MPRPPSITDPLAAQTEWEPLKPGGANFVTHRLVELGPSRFGMKPTFGLKLFSVTFLGAGVVATGVGVNVAQWIPAVMGVVFFAVGAGLLLKRSATFDGQARAFLGSKQVPFGSIHALQILREHVSDSDGGDFDSYELNLVLTNGERINVTDHSGREAVREDARRLSGLIGCKVWDATS